MARSRSQGQQDVFVKHEFPWRQKIPNLLFLVYKGHRQGLNVIDSSIIWKGFVIEY